LVVCKKGGGHVAYDGDGTSEGCLPICVEDESGGVVGRRDKMLCVRRSRSKLMVPGLRG
jgi:hypothetical protein